MGGKEIWNIGGIYQSPLYIIKLKEYLKVVGFDNIELNIFDSHDNLIWNGGNTVFKKTRKKEVFTRVVKSYNVHGIGFNLVFSNLFVEEKHLGDTRCNYILEQCYNEGNGVIVASHILAEYIKKRFPKYKLIHSLTHLRSDVEYYTNLLDLYDFFVLPPDLNYDFAKLKELNSKLGADRIELLVYDTCYRGCPYQKKHYELSSKSVIEKDWDMLEELCDSFCSKHHKGEILKIGATKELLNIKSVEHSNYEVNRLKEMGFSNFKIATREASTSDYIRLIEYYILGSHDAKKSFTAYRKYFIMS